MISKTKFSQEELENLYVRDLRQIAKDQNVKNYNSMNKKLLIQSILSYKTPVNKNVKKMEELEQFYVKDLKQIAKDCKIKNYSVMNKKRLTNVLRKSPNKCIEKHYNKINRRIKSPKTAIKNKPKPKNVKPNSKNLQISDEMPTKESKSPKKVSLSPRKVSTSPRKVSTSPRKTSKSPKKVSTSPRKVSISPKESSKSPRRISKSPRGSSKSLTCLNKNNVDEDKPIIFLENNKTPIKITYMLETCDSNNNLDYDMCGYDDNYKTQIIDVDQEFLNKYFYNYYGSLDVYKEFIKVSRPNNSTIRKCNAPQKCIKSGLKGNDYKITILAIDLV